MQSRTAYSLLFSVTLAVLLTSCAQRIPTTEGEITSEEELVEFLTDENLNPVPVGPAHQPALTTEGEEYRVGAWGNIQIFEYDNEGTAFGEAQRLVPVVPDLGPEADPEPESHVYQNGNMVVVYFGSAPQVTNILNRSLGSQMR
ncbi:MAG: hypothetical protein ACOCTG_03295 [Bacteroidota bacterium]